ncbi:uncharacterized protein PADG_11068 [Paracoccidioides brasiliensis Pb18]|uniref:Piwi domain-containing protein n=1 Tax=Paracoccidioides brasiliensis (strain Pb18) TaxID=502780 RepID=A0A0A0HW40_PARBD|nr:uncharacterized protein PADG_11068 [Paracoccidioides brasiliensis Pb18]KGM92618.1 hypothetical protein PADG_11068 [Paracoccidioides brasiliensis Pb18]
MVVGIDDTHPSPGSASNTPSIAGVVAFMNSQVAQWPADLPIQTSCQEMVSKTSSYILVYRDGVSEGQDQVVLNNELPLLQNIIIVVKRYNARFFLSELGDADHSFNPRNGTVVDRGVTDVRNWDFFLESHTALQGTARPGRYYIVNNDEVKSTAAASAMSRVELTLVEMSQMPSNPDA